MLFLSYSKINKFVLLRHKLQPVLSRLFKATLINLAKYSTVLFCAFAIGKEIKSLTNL
jgi:hypothetical protein